jgi:16S rRNA (guanine966-N2)-methyltransferase
VTPAGLAVRPTADRVREALFNILMHGDHLPEGLAGARVLDLFAGTGALGLEALSRGAGHVVFIEHDRAALRAIERNVQTLRAGTEVTVLARDATRPGGRVGPPATLAFLDPPYGQGLAAPALAALAAGGWLAPGALAVVEVGAREDVAAPAGFTVLDRRRYGATAIVFLRRESGAPDAANEEPS